MTKHLTEQVPWPRDVNPKVSEGCCRLIAKMMAKEVSDRYQTPAELVADLELVMAGGPPRGAAPEAARSSVSRAGALPARPAVESARPRRRPTEATAGTAPLEPAPARRARVPPAVLAAGGTAGVVLLGLVLWTVFGRGRERPKPPDRTAPAPASPASADDDRKFAEMFGYAEKWWREHPDEPDEALAKFRKVADSPGAGVWAMKAGDAAKEVGKARRAALDAALAECRQTAERLAAAQDYDGAMAAYAGAARERPALAERAAAEQEVVRKAAEERLAAAMAEAERLSRVGQPEEGLAALRKAEGLKYAAWAGRLDDLRRRLEEEKKNVAELRTRRLAAEAGRSRDAILDGFDERAAAGRTQEARRFLAEGRAGLSPEQAALVSAELAAAEKVGAELSAQEAARQKTVEALIGRETTLNLRSRAPLKCAITKVAADLFEVQVKYRIGDMEGSRPEKVGFADLAAGELERLLPAYRPGSADGWMAAALTAVGRKDFAAAEQALASAGVHPLAGRYRRKLDVLRLGQAEAAARADWDSAVKPLLPANEPTAAEAAKLLAALDAYLAAHGQSQRARELGPEIERLRALAGRAAMDGPEGMAAAVRKLFRGQVVSFDPKTLAIELLWDFADPRQIEDFELRRGRWKFENGALSGEADARGASVQPWACFAPECRTSCSAALVRGQRAGLLLGALEGGVLLCLGQGGEAVMGGTAREVWKQFAARPLVGFQPGKACTLQLDLAGDRLAGSCEGQPVFTQLVQGEAAAFGCYVLDGTGTFDDLRMAGKLDRAWLQDALRKGSARLGIPGVTAFGAAWLELQTEGEKPRGGLPPDMTYDSKRKLLVLYGEGELRSRKAGNLFALDLERLAFSRVHPKMEQADGKSWPLISNRGHLISYDPENDLYWAGPAWAFDPQARRWKPATAPKDLCFDPFVHWAYDPDGKRFFSVAWTVVADGASSSFFLPKAGTAERQPNAPQLPRRTYLDGGLAYDRRNRAFVLFGGSDYPAGVHNDTWLYSPAAKAWRQARPAVSPPGRYFHKLVWHDQLEALVLFGGHSGKEWLNDLWVYEAAADRWTEVRVPGAPPPCGLVTAYDPAHDVVVLLNERGQTWVLKIARAGGPPKP
jgi:hypothetical protein